MKILIIEDEQLTALKMEKLLRELVANAEIVGLLQSVVESVEWFNTNPLPNVVFMDIHLADGISFNIFDKVEINCPIVFTTAYDEYALKAFEVNSIDYLLKPISKTALQRSLDKIKRLSTLGQSGVNSDLLREVANAILQKGSAYKSSFLIPVKDKFIPLPVKDIAYVYAEERKSIVVTFDSQKHSLNNSLDEITKQLDPTAFFRANRQFIIARKAVKDITVWFGGKVAVNLHVPAHERIFVSRENAQAFKSWLTE